MNVDFAWRLGYNLNPVRIITIGALKRFWESHPDAQSPLTDWYAKTVRAEWKNPAEVKATFPQVDLVKVSSGNTVFVFNITRAYRLIAAIHFDYPRLFVLRILTHREYDRDYWKTDL
jgi:mRNA interferase HigB